MRQVRVLLGVAVLAMLPVGLLTGCGSDTSTSGSDEATADTTAGAAADTTAGAVADTVAPNGESVAVQALDNTFRPETLEIAAGTEVVFTNVGRNEHNVLPADVAPGEMGDWGVATEDFAPQDVYRHVFTRPGTYAYYCSIHGTADVGMIGTIVVTD